MALKFEEIIGDLKQKKFSPIYFLEGEESFFIDEISNFIEQNALSEADKSFNQTVLYGKDSNWKMVLDTVKRFPMMSSHQVVILKEAKDLKDIENLISYFEKPLPSTIFVVCYKHAELDKRKTFGKFISKATHVTYFKAESIKEWDVENWIKQYVSEKGFKINTETSALLKEYLGTDLSKISNELSKLFLNAEKSKPISNDDVEKYIGISKDYNVFEFQKALATKNNLQAYRFVQYCIGNEKENPIQLIMGALNGYFTKLFNYQFTDGLDKKAKAAAIGVFSGYPDKILAEYDLAKRNYPLQKMEKIFSILSEYDLKSKGVGSAGVSNGSLLKEMTAKILNA